MNENSKNWLWVLGIGAIGLALWYFGGKFYRSVSEAIHSWNPGDDLDNETKLRKHLANHLRRNMPNSCRVIEEYAKERSKIDIAISDSDFDNENAENFAIEVKFKLKRKTEIDSLIGQVVGYLSMGFGKTFIVAVDSESNMREVLSKRTDLEEFNGKLTLIDKVIENGE
jgi:hypothetical protein